MPDLAEQRRKLPDQPGVYLFRDASERVIYVGKAISIRKRVASHFRSDRRGGALGHDAMVAEVASIEYIVFSGEGEALLAEQSFIKQYRPRFNIRLRDDKSYPFIAVSLDEDFPRVYFTRERHRRSRAYFGPYSNAKRVRDTLEVLSRVFLVRSCTAAEPGRRSGSPCLDYHIKRCAAPCVGYVSREEYRRGIDGVAEFLRGNYKGIERELEARMKAASEAQAFEQAAVERNRLAAVRSLLERQRVANSAVGTLDAIAVALAGADANAQVFQVRDGVLSDRQSFYLANEGQRPHEEVIEEFLLQYYDTAASVPSQIVVEHAVSAAAVAALSSKRDGPVEVRAAARGEKRRILELAQRNAKLALEEDQLKAERRREHRAEALDGLRQVLGLDTVPVRIECFDISNLMGTHTVASMVVFEAGAPRRSDYRRFRIRSIEGSDDFAAMAEVLERRMAAFERQVDTSPHEAGYDRSFASLPNLIVIDGGKGQLAAGLAALAPARERGVAVIALAKRLEEVFVPGVSEPLRIAHDRPELQLLQRIRDEAHRFAITHHRARRDRAMTASLLDELPGVGPARKKALISHFGSPDQVLAASAEQLQSVPGLPAKVGRELHAHLHRLGARE
ncbi:MAG TPA: excinuclease ABC subunit UvrC [Solirubrobacteraceae bacterium]|jgi:excinuclease ABC subunit C|nr:excinuclease ABC subunit UvrC [Solirubrobacteraceae bacterium]